ncbi:YadA family autotransporter adhesin [Lysobacter enzymogenes]|uniref:YadA family autotransporter adhesin n=1 Tax=Lysobacter enzymogenes TaxID=69 RepID=UPI001AF4EAF9|nr:YadA family autotransporter adhesin [Lysobacter enzymogenes]QQQ03270.1 YadA-like family protein [Lysobacter enzymogenes]
MTLRQLRQLRHPRHTRAFPATPDRRRAAALLRASLLAGCVALALLARPAAAAAPGAADADATPALGESAPMTGTEESNDSALSEADPFAAPAPLLPLVFDGVPNRDTWRSASAFDGGMVSPMSIIEPPPALNNTLPGLLGYLQNWLLGNDYQSCGLLGTGCLTIDRANFNYSYLSLILNLVQLPNAVDLDGNQPANHLTLIGAVHSDSYIQFQDSNYTGNNNNASCVVIGVACTWRTNAAQNNQVLIGDGSYANGSNTIVMGTNARHQLPTISAAAAGFTGGPDTNYAARLGNSVVIGDNSFGNANRQTILGFGATSTHANSVALGAGSSTAVGAQTGYAAFGLAAPQTSSGEVSIGAAGATRKLSNVAAGSVGTDAVNLAQLQGALATAASDPFAVKYDDAGGSPNLQSVTLQGAGGTTLANVRAGAVNAASTQAINGAQAFAISQSNAQRLGGGAAVAADGTVTAPNYVIAGNGYANVGAALAALDGNAQALDAFAVQYDDDGAGNPNYAAITLRGPAGTGTVLGNLAAGQIAAGSLQAVNGGQVFGIGTGIANLFGAGAAFNAGGTFTAPNYVIGGNAYSNVGSALAALDLGAQNADAFAVQYDDDGAGNPNYAAITLRGPAGTGTTLGNVAAGQIAAASLQAINGGQLFNLGTGIADIFGGGATFNAGGTFTAPNYVIGGNAYTNVGAALSALDSNLSSGNAFAVQYDDDGAGNPNYAAITLRGPAGTGTVVGNVAAGQIAANSLQAINGGQLFNLGTGIADVFGGGAAFNAGGTFTAPNYVIGGNPYTNVGAALNALDNGQSAGNAFAVQYDDDGAGNPDYAAITLRGPAGTGTVIDNVAAGQIAAASLQAVNGGQLFDLGSGVAGLFGGGAAFNAGGAFTAPSYSIGGTAYHDVGAALNALDGNQSASNAFAVQYDDDGSGNPDYAAITLRGPAGTGTVIDNLAAGQIAAGSLQAVNGGQIQTMGDSIAAVFGGGSLFNAGSFGAPNYTVQGAGYSNIGAAFAAVDASLTNLNNRIDNLPPATTPDPRVAIDGTGNASVAAGSRGVAVGASASAGGSRATAIGGDSYAAGANDTAVGGNARVNADGSTAVGANSSIAAGATNAVAVGESASATASGAVALGQGAVADRADSVSVGNASQQRQVVNVAAGTQDNDAVNLAQLKASQSGTVRYDGNPDGSVNTTQVTLNNGGAAVTVRNVRAGTANTDAVNVQQLNDGVNRAINTSNQYTDHWGNQLRRDIGQLDDKASAGVASAMAVAGLPQSYMPGKSMAAIAASSFRGESGFAVGISTISEDGRYVYKLSGNSNSKGDVGVTVGAGIVW